jgi:signal transduction histidine kinase
MSRRTWLVIAAAALCGVGASALFLASDHYEQREIWAFFGPFVGWSFVGTGLYARRRRPEYRFGDLMVLTGFAWFLQALAASNTPLVFTIGVTTGALWAAVFIHMLVTFPTGRRETRAQRVVVGFTYVVLLLIPVPLALFSDEEWVTGCARSCPRQLLLVDPGDTAADVALVLATILGLALIAVVIALLIARWRRASPPERRVLGPVFVLGGLSLLLFGGGVGSQSDALFAAAFVPVALVPFGFLAGLARTTVAGSHGVRELVTRLGATADPVEVRQALADALGDPSLSLEYWLPERGEWVGSSGLPVEIGDRAVTEIVHKGRRVAALVHDPALLENPELLRAVGSAAALTLENQRLSAELLARLAELRASRARIVQAGDTERRRLERNLHDGAQSRFVALALDLRVARARAKDDPEVAEALDRAIENLASGLAELRELARGIHPAVLADKGLEPAVRALADRAPMPVEIEANDGEQRLPEQVETTAYFVVAEALTNVAKYAQASRATVSVTPADGRVFVEISDDGIGGADIASGSGLRGLADRVAAVGGTLEVTSPRGDGTRVRAEIPVEWPSAGRATAPTRE